MRGPPAQEIDQGGGLKPGIRERSSRVDVSTVRPAFSRYRSLHSDPTHHLRHQEATTVAFCVLTQAGFERKVQRSTTDSVFERERTLDTSCVRTASGLYTPVRVKPEYMRGKREGAGKKLKALSKMADNREQEATFCCVG
jgi:hypothetical protein